MKLRRHLYHFGHLFIGRTKQDYWFQSSGRLCSNCKRIAPGFGWNWAETASSKRSFPSSFIPHHSAMVDFTYVQVKTTKQDLSPRYVIWDIVRNSSRCEIATKPLKICLQQWISGFLQTSPVSLVQSNHLVHIRFLVYRTFWTLRPYYKPL